MLSYSIVTILMYHYNSTLSLQFYWSYYNQWCTLQLINRTTSLLYMWKLSSYKNLNWSQILILWELWRACKCMEFSIHFRCSIWPHFKCSFSENLINDIRLTVATAVKSNRCSWPLRGQSTLAPNCLPWTHSWARPVNSRAVRLWRHFVSLQSALLSSTCE